MKERPGQTPTASVCSTDGGRDVRFEETLSTSDDEGASRLITVTYVLLAVLTLGSVATFVVVVGATASVFARTMGGFGPAVSVVTTLLAEHPLIVAGGLLVALSTGAYLLVSVPALAGRLRQSIDQQVHVRVTDTSVSVRREGNHVRQPGQASAVDIPLGAITAIDYLDPDESSTRLELGDVLAQKFIAGRSRNWIRIERDGDPAVYVGSDRHVELAETIARLSPGVENAEPY